jgi:hypothetical protein
MAAIAVVKYSQKDVRLSKQSTYEKADSFKKVYTMRSGIEALNSRLDKLTVFKKLRRRCLKSKNSTNCQGYCS